VDFRALALDAWHITRRTPALWWLGLVSAAQVVVYTGIVASLTGPLVALPQLLRAPSASPAAVGSQMQVLRENILVAVSGWLAVHGMTLLFWVVMVMALWIVLGVLDVASQSGLITQAAASAQMRATSFRTGMSDGFRVWWRVVGLLAIAALPSLFSLLVMALVMLITTTLPLLRGAAPDAGAALAGNVILSPLSSLAALVSIPLGVTVQLGMRDAVLSDADWRSALSAGWRLLRTRLAEVAAVYLLVAVVGAAVAVAAVIVLAVVGVAAVALAFATGGGLGHTAAVAGMFVLGLVSLVVLVPLTVLDYVWASCIWTLFWQRAAGGGPTGTTMTSGQPTTLN